MQVLVTRPTRAGGGRRLEAGDIYAGPDALELVHAGKAELLEALPTEPAPPEDEIEYKSAGGRKVKTKARRPRRRK